MHLAGCKRYYILFVATEVGKISRLIFVVIFSSGLMLKKNIENGSNLFCNFFNSNFRNSEYF